MEFPQLDGGRYASEKALLDRVALAALGNSAILQQVEQLRLVQEVGAVAVYEAAVRRKRSEAKKAEVAIELATLITDFNAWGVAGLFVPTSARGGDFLINYTRGLWAERILARALEATGEYVLVSYGPSTPPMPG